MDVTESAAAGYREGLYDPEMTRATYQELFEQARISLSEGLSVVIDASFHDPATRDQAADVAESTYADLDQVRCEAPLPVMEERILERLAKGPGRSDASVAVTRAMQAEDRPWPSAIQIDTARPIEEVKNDLLGRLAAAT
jgi:predicted kinase